MCIILLKCLWRNSCLNELSHSPLTPLKSYFLGVLGLLNPQRVLCTDGHSIELFYSCFCAKTRLKKPLDSAARAEGGGGAEPASLVNTR